MEACGAQTWLLKHRPRAGISKASEKVTDIEGAKLLG